MTDQPKEATVPRAEREEEPAIVKTLRAHTRAQPPYQFGAALDPLQIAQLVSWLDRRQPEPAEAPRPHPAAEAILCQLFTYPLSLGLTEAETQAGLAELRELLRGRVRDECLNQEPQERGLGAEEARPARANPHIGSTLEGFLAVQEPCEECNARPGQLCDPSCPMSVENARAEEPKRAEVSERAHTELCAPDGLLTELRRRFSERSAREIELVGGLGITVTAKDLAELESLVAHVAKLDDLVGFIYGEGPDDRDALVAAGQSARRLRSEVTRLNELAAKEKAEHEEAIGEWRNKVAELDRCLVEKRAHLRDAQEENARLTKELQTSRAVENDATTTNKRLAQELEALRGAKVDVSRTNERLAKELRDEREKLTGGLRRMLTKSETDWRTGIYDFDRAFAHGRVNALHDVLALLQPPPASAAKGNRCPQCGGTGSSGHNQPSPVDRCLTCHGSGEAADSRGERDVSFKGSYDSRPEVDRHLAQSRKAVGALAPQDDKHDQVHFALGQLWYAVRAVAMATDKEANRG